MLSLSLKRFFRNKVFTTLLSVFYLVMIWQFVGLWQITRESTFTQLSFLGNTLSYAPFVFAFFLLISFEYVYRIHQEKVSECVGSSSYGLSRYYSSSILALLILLLPLVAMFLGSNLYNYLSQSEVNYIYIAQIFAHAVFEFFVVGLIAIFLGTAIAFTASKLKAYLILCLAAFLFLPLTEFSLLLDFFSYRTQNTLQSVFGLFDIFAPDLEWWQPILGVSLLPYRIGLFFFWLALLSLVLSALLNRSPQRSWRVLITQFVMVVVQAFP
ncbi:MAG TPA: hypothetical protein GXZ59_02775 [Clostridiaceae bacterium]|nr:hypothetical protein [Clostridiaceae bacterium]